MTRRSPAALPWVVLSLVGTLVSGPALGENMDPTGVKVFAWSENGGWLNTQPLGAGGVGMHVRDFDVTGWIWAENAGWVSLSCRNTNSCGTTSYGVANNGAGVLTGFAWSENAGWIDVAAGGVGGGGVTINPASGVFNGYAWSENLGWISFANSGVNPFQVATSWRCSPPPSPPAGSPIVTLARSGATTTLAWSASAGATGFDVVRGDLGVLRATGSFQSSTQQCLANDSVDASLSVTAVPPTGAGYWYLVRGVNCGGAGSFGAGEPGQLGSRDAGIAASPNRCP